MSMICACGARKAFSLPEACPACLRESARRRVARQPNSFATQAQRNYRRALYGGRRTCLHCGVRLPPAPPKTAAHRWSCADCRKKRRYESAKKLREFRIANSLCTKCGGDRERDDRRYCIACRKKELDRKRSMRHDARTADLR